MKQGDRAALDYIVEEFANAVEVPDSERMEWVIEPTVTGLAMVTVLSEDGERVARFEFVNTVTGESQVVEEVDGQVIVNRWERESGHWIGSTIKEARRG